MMRTRRILQGILWIFIYLGLTLAPVFFMLIEPRPAGREFWREFSVALGFAGLAMMALQFVLTARFKFLKAPYGSDIVYFFHRQISLVTFFLIMAHPIMLFVTSIHPVSLLNMFDPDTPWRARFATVSVLALIGIVVTAVWRKPLKIDYTRWRIWHGILATAAVSLAMAHIVGVGYYVNTPWKRALWIGYAIFWIGLLLYTRVIKPIVLLKKPYQVVGVKQERGNAWTLELAAVGHKGFTFQPGQFAWITAWNSPFKDTEHPFSISSGAVDGENLQFTIKELGDFTSTVKQLKSGQTVYVDGPYGAFSMDRHSHAQQLVMVAGGIGITPMMSMLRTMADRGDQRRVTLLYANRDWESFTFREELEELKTKINLNLVYVIEKPSPDWTGESGFVNQRILDQYLPKERKKNLFEIFICGPKPMMDAVEAALVRLGIDYGDFHSERFDMV